MKLDSNGSVIIHSLLVPISMWKQTIYRSVLCIIWANYVAMLYIKKSMYPRGRIFCDIRAYINCNRGQFWTHSECIPEFGRRDLASSCQADVWHRTYNGCAFLVLWGWLLSFRCWHYPEMEVAGPYVTSMNNPIERISAELRAQAESFMKTI